MSTYNNTLSTSNNNTADQEIAQLKKQIADGTESTKSYLTSLQTKIADYDKEHQLSDTASSYLQAGIDKANWSLEELKDFGARFKDGSKDLSDDIIKSGKSALANLQSSLESLKSQASEYDAKASKSANNASHEMSKKASNAKYEVEKGASNAKHEVNSLFDSKSANNASHEASKKASNAKYEVEKGASDAKHEVQKEASNAKSTLSDLFDSARDQGNSWFDSLSTSFENLQKQISANATAASNAVSNAAQATTDKVAETDKNVTGGVGADLYNKTADLVNQGVDYVSSALQGTPAEKTSTVDSTPLKP